MNIFKIQTDYLKISEELLENGGELTEELSEALSITEEALQVKSVSIAQIIKQNTADCDVIKKEIERLTAMKKARENANERLKELIKNAMETFGISEIKGELFKLSFRKSEAVVIEDENQITPDYVNVKEVKTVDKTAIKEALKEGKEVPGAKLEVRQNLQIK